MIHMGHQDRLLNVDPNLLLRLICLIIEDLIVEEAHHRPILDELEWLREVLLHHNLPQKPEAIEVEFISTRMQKNVLGSKNGDEIDLHVLPYLT
jgi:hypothetical protein